MNAWKVILSTLVIFIAGVITGGLLVTNAVKVIGSRPNKNSNTITNNGNNSLNPWMARNRELLRRMDRELELTPVQHDHIDKILAASQERTKFLWKPIVPQMTKEVQLAHSQIRDELTPEQRKKYDGIVRHPSPERQERQERRRAGMGTNALGNTTNSVTGLTNTLTTNLISATNLTTNAAPANP